MIQDRRLENIWIGSENVVMLTQELTGTLCCDTAEEARTLIPSLEGKISDDDLQAVLDNISKLRDFS
jgi:DNA-directed RNA polymerase II subunit RPB4